MCDFSSSNSLPQPPQVDRLYDILAALNVLALLVEEVCQPFVGAVVTAARKFLLHQKTLRAIVETEALADLIRTLVVLGSVEGCDSIQSKFNAAHESYVQVQNVVYEQQLSRLERSSMCAQYPALDNSSHRVSRDRQGVGGKQTPEQVLNALPSQNGKSCA
ncbi:hypothetical protein PHMEG_0004739 [Phytophthora megakarya]|uniref:Uncharacterized protein n=1 Tax=Phytophthora megakarya TaxID=4795 RepID=A0A225WT52_9STRA|nr:hypothetical protein PHMEG_0004739 [Phytophthora megakarya]